MAQLLVPIKNVARTTFLKKRRVALIEFSMYDTFPLVSGYLHSYAKTDPEVEEAFEFIHYQKEVELSAYEDTLRALRALNAEILCFSCYVWNMGLVKRLVRDLRNDPGIKTIILGGHQVTNHLEHYIERSDQKTIVINGRGEIPFRAVLKRLARQEKAAGLKGISCHIDGEVWNGGEAEMLSNLDDIPSPFLSGLFDQMLHPITIFETNRGCPYQCTFCTWGGDTFAVTKFSLDRIKEELKWITKKSIFFIWLADANWGMLSRDAEISEHIARLKKDHGFPWMVYYSAAKNKPKGSLDCIEKFHAGGVMSSQALGIQSLNPITLEMIERKNIRNSAFIEMFDHLKGRKIDSYCELIWPLPGETLETLKAGFEQLIDLGARTIIMYPAILINNAQLTDEVDKHGIETLMSDDWKAELKLVKKTKYADRNSVDAGLWFYYASFFLANCDMNKGLLRYLRHVTGKSHAGIITEFADYLRARGAQCAYANFIDSIFQEEAHGSSMTVGRLAAHLLHEERFAIQQDLANFLVDTQLCGETTRGLALAGLWAFSLPRLFTNTEDDQVKIIGYLDKVARGRQTFSNLTSVTRSAQKIVMNLRAETDVWREIVPFFSPKSSAEGFKRIEIEHPPQVYVYTPNTRNRAVLYANGMILRLSYISASISVAN